MAVGEVISATIGVQNMKNIIAASQQQWSIENEKHNCYLPMASDSESLNEC